MKIFGAAALLFFCGGAARAAFATRPPSARALALGGSLTADGGSLDGLVYNPAGLAALASCQAAAYRTEILGLRALPYQTFSFGMPTARGGWGLAFSSLSHSFYKEDEWRLGRGVRRGRWTWGAALRYSSVTIARYGSARVFSLDVGALVELRPGIVWGFSCRSLNQPSLGSGETLPAVLRSGLVFKLSSLWTGYVDGVVSGGRGAPGVWQGGLEWSPMSRFFLRAGLAGAGHEPSFGMGFHLGRIAFDYGIRAPAGLDPEQHLGVVWSWGREREAAL